MPRKSPPKNKWLKNAVDKWLKLAIALELPRNGPIYLMHIYKRDLGICGICGNAVPMNGKGRLGWSIDHIIPLKLGGPHLRDNVQLAHRGCNSRKRQKVQASLIHSRRAYFVLEPEGGDQYSLTL